MPFKKWNILKEDPELTRILAEECEISTLAASILVSRGHTAYADAVQFLTPEEEFASPFEIVDMDKAAARILQAVDEFEKITIYGDYDCDGVTSTAILYTYLSSIGADVAYYIPERDGEGYGLHRDAIDQIASDGTTLLITVDNGISAVEEVAYASELGLDVVITDHHQPGDLLPEAAAVVDPHRRDCNCSYRDYAGVGVAFKLIAALEGGDYQTALEYFADVVAVGTIGDIVPLTGENRLIVKYGLRALGMSDNIGLLALMKAASIKPGAVTAQNVTYALVPRINAAGRMGSAGLAVKLLLSEEESEAEEIAAKLDGLNRDRQEQEQAIVADIIEMVSRDPALLSGRLLILKSDRWNHGIIGIACSRLLERFGKPVLLMGQEGDVLTGSARSVGEFHLFNALSANANHLLRYGGHQMAAGFSLNVDEFDAFRQGMEEYARKNHDIMPQYTITLDKQLTPEDLTIEAIQSLSALEPFGAKNDPPLFLLRQATLESAAPLSGDKHQRLTLRLGNQLVTALWFGMSSDQLPYAPGAVLDFAVRAEINEYNGRQSVSLKVRDARPSGFPQNKFFSAKGYYEKIRRGEPVSNPILAHSTPSREETAVVYRFLKACGGFRGDIDTLYIRLLGQPGASDINYCKLRILLDVLNESGLIALSPALDGIALTQTTAKVDLNAAPTMQSLLMQMKQAQP